MKSLEKVITDRIKRIECNNLTTINYIDHKKIVCRCKKCNYEIIDNYRNLSYSNFKCSFCDLLEKSDLLRTGIVKLISINGVKLKIKCKNGHEYSQDRRNLLSGRKCEECRKKKRNITKDILIQKLDKIHGRYYTYELNGYKNLQSKIKITCKEGHRFEQIVSNHLQGKGCPICRESLGERKIRIILEEKQLKFIRQKKFKECKFVNELPFDFYLIDYNLLIEFDGIQHFKPVKAFGGEEEFKKTQIKDAIKNDFCLKNEINLLRISYKDDIDYLLSKNLEIDHSQVLKMSNLNSI